MEVAATTSSAPVTTPNTQNLGNDRGDGGRETEPQHGTEIQGEKEGIHAEEKQAPKPKVKKKFVVDKKEVELELDDETTDKYIQKALAADKRFSEARKREQELEAIAHQVHQKRQELEQFMAALDDDSSAQEILLKKLGPERFRQLAEAYLAPVVQEEILKERNPLEYELKKTQRELEIERKEKNARLEAEKRQKYESEVNELKTKTVQEYENAILKAMDTGAIPRNERSIAQFADYMRKLVERGQEVTEEAVNHIARTVKEDKIDDIKWLVSGFSQMAKQAMEAKDDGKLIKIGDELTQMFGEDMVNLIRRSDLAKIRAGQPNIPKQILDTPRVDPKQGQQSKLMSPDEWRDEVRNRALQIDAESRRAR